MERAGIKTRDIRFWSDKNDCMVCAHSKWARDYAKYLEEQSWIEGYEVNVSLDPEQFNHVSPVDIRSEYFQTGWTSDFSIRYADGRKGIRELASREQLRKLANIERLELSRRYWAAMGIDDWAIVLISEGGVET